MTRRWLFADQLDLQELVQQESARGSSPP